jgi:hypothetical protein
MPVKNFEPLNPNSDVTTTRTLLHEAIPITGSIVSGTYSDNNIKNYTHGQFQSVYDYPYLSSSANHIFDLTIGYDNTSFCSASSNTQNSKKINSYNQFAQTLLGYTGSANDIEIFESDLDFGDNNSQMKEVFMVNFSRLLYKDQMKKGTFSIAFGTASWVNPFNNAGAYTNGTIVTLTDASASAANSSNTTQTRGGDYGVLYASGSMGSYALSSTGSNREAQGVVFYQQGIAIISASVFNMTASQVAVPAGSSASLGDFYYNNGTTYTTTNAWASASISGTCDAIRARLYSLSFQNTTEINSQIYFCRAPHNKFNYSSNPTYTTGSKIRVKNVASDQPVSYITTVGLYSANNELLAVAKVSEPIAKRPTNELVLRVRLDY